MPHSRVGFLGVYVVRDLEMAGIVRFWEGLCAGIGDEDFEFRDVEPRCGLGEHDGG